MRDKKKEGSKSGSSYRSESRRKALDKAGPDDGGHVHGSLSTTVLYILLHNTSNGD